jgi:hypothetical protein
MSVPINDPADQGDDPIERYLDELLVSLPGSPREVRHLLAEVEGHLDDLVDAGRRAGLDEPAARADAVRRMGSVHGVVTRPHRLFRWTPARRRRLALGGLLIGGVGGVAIGLAAVIAAFVRAVWGDRAIAVPFPTGSYTAADCARWMRLYPSRSCIQAMIADHAFDFVMNAAACGVVGAIALVAYVVLRRRWASRAVAASLPPWSEYLIGAILAGLATIGLTAEGVDAILVTHGRGVGQPFSLAAAAAGAALVLGLRAWQLRRRPLLHPIRMGRDTPG